VKSCSLVPTASTTSASTASALAALLPVTPIDPTLFGWAQARLPLPAWVSATGRPCRSAKPARVPGGAGIQHAAAGDHQRAFRPSAAPRRRGPSSALIRAGAADAMDPFREETRRG